MKNLLKLAVLFGLSLASMFAQTALTQTSTSAAITVNQTTFAIASATGIAVQTSLYVADPGQYRGELMRVTAINGTTVTVVRTSINKAPHASGSMVLAGPAAAFAAFNPSGSCTAANTLYTPWVNAQTGEQWLCSTVTLNWVPGWGNAAAKNVTAAVASAAGLITPSGPLFHITGALAITGFNTPVGYNGGGFCAIPDGLYTTTTANNIALASTAVVSRPMCWSHDTNAAKVLFPSY